MEKMHLVAIDRDGTPVDHSRELSEAVQDACRSCGLLYELYGFHPPWIGYLAGCGAIYVGSCAFKSPPRDGQVEIAHVTFPHHEGHDHATAMVAALIDIAAVAQPGIRILALTVPEEKNAPGSVLDKLGFQFDGAVQHPEDGLVWQWSRQANTP